MSNASISMLACGVYLIIIGILCLFFPVFVLTGIGVVTPPDVMSRMCGMIFLIFAYIYIRTGIRDEGMEFFYILTVQERCTLPIFLTSFYLLGYANWVIVVFGFIDLSFAIWTYIALRTDRKKTQMFNQ